VPLLLVSIDYGRKIVDVTRTLTLTGDEAADMAAIAQAYDGVQAKYPKDAAPIRLAEPGSDDARKQVKQR
jgi:hypothetical protein